MSYSVNHHALDNMSIADLKALYDHCEKVISYHHNDGVAQREYLLSGIIYIKIENIIKQIVIKEEKDENTTA